MKTKGVVLVDDHAIVRAALVSVLESQPHFFRVLGEAANAEEACSVVRSLSPDLIFIDHLLPKTDGLLLMTQLREILPSAQFVVFTQSQDPLILRNYWSQNQVIALLSKSSPLTEIRLALHQIQDGERFLAQDLSKFIDASQGPTLTRRELEVARMVVGGLSNKEIGQVLGCSDHTIKTHKTNIMGKLGVTTSVEVATWALKNGLS